jgi:hypothetical protein
VLQAAAGMRRPAHGCTEQQAATWLGGLPRAACNYGMWWPVRYGSEADPTHAQLWDATSGGTKAHPLSLL